MKNKLLKPHLWISLSAVAVLALPVALAAGCNDSTTSTPTTPELTPAQKTEQATQASIVSAPANPATSTVNDSLLQSVRTLAASQASSTEAAAITKYLAEKTPGDLIVTQHLPVLLNEVKRAWSIAKTTTLNDTSAYGIFNGLNIDLTALLGPIDAYFKDFDGKGTNALSSWTNYLAVWTYAFNPANNYENLKSLLTKLTFSDKNLNDFNAILSGPLNKPSGVKTAAGADINGFGGVSIFVSPTEKAAQDAILAATTTSTDALKSVQLMVTTAATAANVTPAVYLATNAPWKLSLINYAPILVDAVAKVWNLPNNGAALSTFEGFVGLFNNLDISIEVLTTKVPARLETYGDQGKSALLSWASFQTAVNSFYNATTLQAFFTTPAATQVITDTQFTNLNTVLSTAVDQVSTVKSPSGGDILGFGGTSVFATTTA